MVRPLPHQSTGSRSDKPSSSVIVRRACPGAPLSVQDESMAFTEHGQHSDRQTLKPAFPVGPFFAQDRWAPTLSVAPLALPTADSSQLPYPH
jgi:hypothetical protein